MIVSSSTTVAAADSQTHGRFLFLSQTLPDNSQTIIKRIGELQKQIDELKRQTETLPAGTPGKLIVTERSASYSLQEGGSPGFTEAKASCNSDEVVTGGGYDMHDQAQGLKAQHASENAWVLVFDNGLAPSGGGTVFAECAKIS